MALSYINPITGRSGTQMPKYPGTTNTNNWSGIISASGIFGGDKKVEKDTTKDTTVGGGELQSYIDNFTEAQKKARIAALDSAYNTATGNLKSTYDNNILNLNNTQSGIAGSYQVKKNNAAAQSDVGGYNFAQYMAARGIKGSAGGLPEIYRNMALQNTLGTLDTAEAQDNANIDLQKAALLSNYNTSLDTMKKNYETDKIGAGAEVDAQALDQKVAAWKDAAAKTANEKVLSKDEWLANIGQFSADYQKQIDILQKDNDPTNDWQIPYLQRERQAKLDAQENQAKEEWMYTINQFSKEPQKEIARLEKLKNEGQTIDYDAVPIAYKLNVLRAKWPS